jgi:hypothetical protein
MNARSTDLLSERVEETDGSNFGHDVGMASGLLAPGGLAAEAPQRRILVFRDHALRLAVLHHLALVDPDDAGAQPRDRCHVVRDEQHREAALRFLGDPLEAPFLEGDVADGEDLVRQQDVGLHVDGHRKCQPQIHAARVLAQRVVGEVVQFGELEDLGNAIERFAARDPVHGGVHQDVVLGREIGVEPGAELEQRDDPPETGDASLGRAGDAGDHLEQRGLPCPVRADDPQDRPRRDRERHVPQRPQITSLAHAPRQGDPRQRHSRKPEIQRLARCGGRLLRRDEVALAEVFDDQAIHVCAVIGGRQGPAPQIPGP